MRTPTRLFVLLLSAAVSACSPEDRAGARERFEAERARARAGLEAAAERLDQQAAELREKLRSNQDQAAEQWRRALEDVEARKAVARQKLATLADVGLEAWQDVRAGFERAAEDLQRAADEARTPPASKEDEAR
jgi:hypothetical protein